jgi:macrolide transport system ATP-binding/permease protein
MPDPSTSSRSSGAGSRDDWKQHLRSRLASLRLSPAREAEIIDELSQHLDERYAELRRGGVAEDEADRLAIEELCDADTLARHMRPLRQAHVPPPIDPGTPGRAFTRDLGQDLRYGFRMLLKQPGFTVAVVLTLALGIGANTAVFSLVNAMLFQHLPVPNRERLVYVYRGTSGVFSYPGYAWLRDGNHTLDGLAAWGGISASLNSGDRAELVSGAIVTGSFFDLLGIRAGHGRLISTADDVKPGAHPVTVISHDFWQTRFAGAPDIVGRGVRLNGHPFTIIGIAPAGFTGPQLGIIRDLYVPMMMQAIMRPPRAGYSGEMNPDLLNNRTNSWLYGLGRLKPGVTVEQARAELDILANTFAQTLATNGPPPRHTANAVPIDQGNVTERQQLVSVALLLGGVVGAVLLIGCANIANLLLSRAASRRRELAVRLAIGASRARIIRQLLAESLLLSLMGGAAGLGLAWAMVRGFRAAPPPAGALPVFNVVVDHRVLWCSLALSIATGVVFGLLPALKASKPNVVPALRDAADTETRGRRFGLKQGLVVAEVALSFLLLMAAGLFVRSLQSAQHINPGFDAEKLLSAPLNTNLLRYTTVQGREFYRQIVERVERLPGVESATLARVAVLTGGSRVLSLHVEGRGDAHDLMRSEGGTVTRDPRATNVNIVGPRFFKTLGIPLVLGRDFTDQDNRDRPLVTIVNSTLATAQFGGVTPVGKRVSFDGSTGPWREIVGVVSDSKYGALSEDAVSVAYLPLSQNHETGMTLYARTSVPPETLVAAVRREIQSLEPNLPVPNLRTVTDAIGTSLYGPRMGAWLLSAFGAVGVLLATVGIYGVLSFSTARRTHEIGIRLALGATTHDVFALVVRDGMLLVVVGIAIGIASGLLAARSLATLLYGVTPSDVPTFIITTILLIGVALAACAIPARRAMRVQPISALRQE